MFLLTLFGCGTVPKKVIEKIQSEGFAGNWVRYKYDFGGKTDHTKMDYVQITCDGELKYSIDEPAALLFKSDTDDGKIIEFDENKLKVKSWIGFEFNYFISKAVIEKNGCHSLNFKGYEFKTFYPYDCSKPRKTFYEAMDEAYDFLKNKNYVYCD
jgi:hypothetical protein